MNRNGAVVKLFPVRLAARLAFVAVILLVMIRYFLLPPLLQLRGDVLNIWSLYSGSAKDAAFRFEKERSTLVELEKKVLPQTDPTKKSAAYYDFLQESVRKHGVSASKITSGEQFTANNVRREDYSLKFVSGYHSVGALISDIETGPYFCSVRSLHIVSQSLTDNTLDADMSLSFYRLAQ